MSFRPAVLLPWECRRTTWTKTVAGYNVEVNADEISQPVELARLKSAVGMVLGEAGIRSAEIGVAIVSDDRIPELNREYLGHDYPTDVLSFMLEEDQLEKTLDGEIIVSADYAAREAERYGWTTDDELLLYVIHGTLHLVGHDDATPKEKAAMREA